MAASGSLSAAFDESSAWVREQLYHAADDPAPAAAHAALRQALAALGAGDAAHARFLAAQARELQWQVINRPQWRDVNDDERGLYGAAVALEACCDASAGLPTSALRVLDSGLLLATAEQQDRLRRLIALLKLPEGDMDTRLMPAFVNSWHGVSSVRDARLEYPPCPLRSTNAASQLPRLASPSLLAFYSNHFLPRVPVVLEGASESWPAHSRWADPHYLLRVAGCRTVPVEVGRDYMAKDWTQVLMTVNEFVGAVQTAELRRQAIPFQTPATGSAGSTSSASLSGTASGTPYLAQHGLFDQIPALRADVQVPDYCALQEPPEPGDDAAGPETTDAAQSHAEGPSHHASHSGVDACVAASGPSRASRVLRDGEVAVQTWIGPGGTVSCLHYDEPHNLLAQVSEEAQPCDLTLSVSAQMPSPSRQVIGYKYLRLYAPAATPCLYPREGAMSNTSSVDVAEPDAAAHPSFARAPFLECTLGPGDTLYIPPRWWHYAAALTPSWSVSFWWGASY